MVSLFLYDKLALVEIQLDVPKASEEASLGFHV